MTINNEKGTALFMTMMVLTGVLTVSLSVASIVMSDIIMSRTQTNSTKAYFAAEAGAERILYLARKESFLSGASCTGLTTCVDFTAKDCVSCDDAGAKNNLTNGSSYKVEYFFTAPNVNIVSAGTYSGARRSVEIGY